MQTTASSARGAVHPGQGRAPASCGCRPISWNKSSLRTGAGDAAAGLAAGAGREGEAAFWLAAALAGFAAAAAAPCGAAIFSGCLHFGHLTVLPANSSLAANAAPQAHSTLMGIIRFGRCSA